MHGLNQWETKLHVMSSLIGSAYPQNDPCFRLPFQIIRCVIMSFKFREFSQKKIVQDMEKIIMCKMAYLFIENCCVNPRISWCLFCQISHAKHVATAGWYAEIRVLLLTVSHNKPNYTVRMICLVEYLNTWNLYPLSHAIHADYQWWVRLPASCSDAIERRVASAAAPSESDGSWMAHTELVGEYGALRECCRRSL